VEEFVEEFAGDDGGYCAPVSKSHYHLPHPTHGSKTNSSNQNNRGFIKGVLVKILKNIHRPLAITFMERLRFGCLILSSVKP
jgi:hypothetical protein